jgi:hypothetical protein
VTIPLNPGLFEVIVSFLAALGTRTMTGSKSCRFIGKEKFGVATRRHKGSFAIFEFGKADDPVWVSPTLIG